MKPKVFAHTSYIGTGGYNNHSRDFFRHLSKLIDVKVRNFTIGNSWKGMGDECHNGESYINDTDKKILNQQTLWEDESCGKKKDWDIYSNYPNDFNHNINIVLNETDHYFFYDKMVGPKIGYNVWESTLQPKGFFNKWKEFDQLWVPSQWQAECTINQGVDSDKVKVVPEGVDVNTFFPEVVEKLEEYDDDKFKFLLFGRWDYRKSTKEIIKTFLNTFSPDEDVEIVVSIDNAFSKDNIKSTEDRLKHYGFEDKRIKVKHFPSREDYISYLKTGHVFLSCARSEGWNLPLIEAMACGTPSIYSECSGQMEFASGKGLPVKILGEKVIKATNENFKHGNTHIVGNYYEPDFENLSKVMREAYKNYNTHKKQALKDAKLIHKDFNWDRVAEIGRDTLVDFMKNYKEPKDTNEIIVTYNNGPKVEIKGDIDKKYNIQFIDKSCNCTIHRDTIKNNMWTTCNRKYFTEWVIKINGVVVNEFNLKNKKVFIDFKSSSIGDTIAWFPYVEEFRKKHDCKIVCHTFHNGWFKEHYPKIQLGVSTDSYASYNIGWFYKNNKWDGGMHKNDFKPQPLQKTATDVLGLEFEEIKPKIKSLPKSPIKEKYVTISIQSTAQCKYWNHPTGWQQVVDYLQKNGYKVVSVDLHPTFGVGDCQNTIPKVDYYYNNKPLDEVMSVIEGADFHLGIGSGLSWMAWALNTQVVLISSFTEPYCEFTTNCIRIYNDTPTSGYFNTHRLDPSNWNWYPFKEINNMRGWYKVESITPEQVIKGIEKSKINKINKINKMKKSKIKKEFNWGESSEWYKSTIQGEIFDNNCYESIYPVREGDVVLDLGGSIGPFTWDVMDKASKVYVMEPTKAGCDAIKLNTEGFNVEVIEKALGFVTNKTYEEIWTHNGNDNKLEQCTILSFQDFLREYKIDKIDFIKTDCEGGEYALFTEATMPFLLNNVRSIVGEWHLGSPGGKVEFRYFRDKYLKQFPNVEVRSVDGVDIKWDLYNEHFMEHYNEVIIHLNNEKIGLKEENLTN